MFLAPTASSLRYNRAEREVSGYLFTRVVPPLIPNRGSLYIELFSSNEGSGTGGLSVSDKLRQPVADGFRQIMERGNFVD